jgi:hypothetical protein
VDFSDLDYTSDDIAQIDIDLAYDYAILEYWSLIFLHTIPKPYMKVWGFLFSIF